MKRTVLAVLSLIIVVQLVLTGAAGAQAPQTLRLATTTSTEDSGLLRAILPVFEQANNATVDVVAVGSGQAIEIGTKGDADVLLVHSRKAEDQFVKDGHAKKRSDVMYNDFILVGPTEDPAGVKGLATGKEAFKKIMAAGATFASRGDKSGTNTKEIAVWASVPVTPTAEMAWYKSLGQGMGETLLFSQESKAYTLTDRGTWLSMQSKLPGLAVMVGGNNIDQNKDATLLNPYGVLVVDPEKHPGVNSELAGQFAAWLLSVPTQNLIGEFGKEKFGDRLFYPDSIPFRETKFNIFHAGSLAGPVKDMIARFKTMYPNADVRTESAGSVDLARRIADSGRMADVFMSADYSVIDDVLLGKYATWNIKFARNDMVLVYGDGSKFAAEITPDNWTEVLLRPGVVFGHSDPNLDPAGYRALMVMQLAEKHYEQAGLYGKLQAAITPESIRPRADDLIALVKDGKMDYAFEYRSVAMQSGLKFLELPAEVNLGDPAKADWYAQASVEIKGADGKTSVVKGLPIVYGLTIPTNAKHPEVAAEFVKLVLGPDGQAIMDKAGQPPIAPALVADPAIVPVPVQPLVAK